MSILWQVTSMSSIGAAEILKYFGFTEHPFMLTPDPRYLFFTPQVSEAIAKCEFMAKERIGPIYMYGPYGTGKSTLARRLQERLEQDEKYIVKLLITPNIKTSNQLLRSILDAFDVNPARSYMASLKTFGNYLIEQFKEGKIPVLLIDEAQNLSSDCLKLIHYLFNFETNTTKLLQVVLIGQDELGAKVNRFEALANRMFPITINAMSIEEFKEMIKFRLMVAGSTQDLFTDEEAYKTLYTYSRGLPRSAIKVSSELLINLAVKGKAQATAKEVEEVAKAQGLRL